MSRNGLSVFALAVIVGVSACCSLCPAPDPHQKLIAQLDDYMIPLARAIDVVVDSLPPSAADKEIFDAAAERSGNPGLIKPFEGYVLKARIQDGAGIVLLCSNDGKEGIIEDVSCTTRPDSHRPTGSPCAYLLDAGAVCAAP